MAGWVVGLGVRWFHLLQATYCVPRLSSIAFSGVMIVGLVGYSLGVDEDTVGVAEVGADSVIIVTTACFLSLFFLVGGFLVLCLSFFSLFFSGLGHRGH